MNRISDVETDMTEVIMSSFAPIETPDAEMESGRGVWETLDVRGRPSRRYEGCMVMVNGLGYLIGGRGMKDVSILDPVQKSWRNATGPGFEMHHMQCVVYELKIWIVSCWTGKFPMEEAVEHVWIYNVVTDTWERRQGLPKGRRRGAGASVLHDGKIWVVGGNQGGHGGHSNTLGYVDYYDLLLDKWVLQLAELPEGRDHVGGAIVNVGHEQQLCISGGRDSGRTNVLTAIISSTFCYSFSRNEWVDMKNDIPVGRAGAAVTSTCDGKMMVAGGEAMLVYDRVDIFDGVTWSETGRLNTARHGAGIAVSDCSCSNMFMAAGSADRGGKLLLSDTELYLPDGIAGDCEKY